MNSTRITVACLISVALAACSKPAVESTMESANAIGTKFMAALEQKDASHQAEGLIRLLEDQPECQTFKDQLREAGKGPPAAGTTQNAILKAYEAAKQAGCRKSG